MVQDFVLFVDNFEEHSVPHFGLLLADGNMICLCCGGIIEPENYTILEHYGTENLCYAEETLKQYF